MALVPFKAWYGATGKYPEEERTPDTGHLAMWTSSFEAISPIAMIEIRPLLAFAIPTFFIPFPAALKCLWHARIIKNGTHASEIAALHRQLGHFVRIAPDEVSVAHPDGPRKLLLETLPKVGTGTYSRRYDT